MKRHQRFYFTGVLIFIQCITALFANWEQTNGPGAGQILSIVSDGSTVFAGLDGGDIFKSTDNGKTWSSGSGNLPQKDAITALICVDNTLFAGTNSGMYQSTDNGENWSEVRTFRQKQINCLQVDGSSILAGTFYDGLYQSSDKGATWERSNSGLEDSCILSITLQSNTIYLGTQNAIYRSTNSGSSWSQIKLHSGMRYYSIILCGNTIIAGTNPLNSDGSVGIIFSTDNGANWTSSEPGLKFKGVRSLAAIGTSIFAATYGDGIFVSNDNGKTWKATSNGLTCKEVTALTVDGTTIFAGTEGGVFRSDDKGKSWVMASSGITKVWVSALSAQGTTVYAGTDQDGVFFSADNGSQWSQVVSGLERDRIYSLAVNNNIVLAGTDSMGIFRLSTNNASWNSVGNGTIQNVPVIDLTVIGTTIFAKSLTDVYRSTDNGERWSSIGAGFPVGAGTAFAMKDGTIYTGADNGVYKSTDNGATWQEANGGLEGKKVISLTVQGSTIFAGTYIDGVYRSTDNGAHWTKSTDWSYGANRLITVCNSVLGISSTTVFVTEDSGATWTNINNGIESTQISSITASDRMLLVGTRYDGIWRREISEVVAVVQPSVNRTAPHNSSPEIITPSIHNPTMMVSFTLVRSQKVSIAVYNTLGRKVASLVNNQLQPGKHHYFWNISSAATGCYTVHFNSDSYRYIKSIPVIR